MFKNKTLNTSFWRVENVEYVDQSASISIKNGSILDLPVGAFSPQSLIHFGFTIYEVGRRLICHLARKGCYNPNWINDIRLLCIRGGLALVVLLMPWVTILNPVPAQP